MKYLLFFLIISTSAKAQTPDSLITSIGDLVYYRDYPATFIVYPCNMCSAIRVDGYVINEYDPKDPFQVKIRYVDLQFHDIYRGRFKNAKVSIWKP